MQFLHSPLELREVDREREDMAAGRRWTVSVEETGPGAAKDSGGGRCLGASSTLEDNPSGGGGLLVRCRSRTSKDRDKAVSFESVKEVL